MVSSRLKKAFENYVASSVKFLASVGLTANTVTLIGLLFSFAAAWVYINWHANRLMLPFAAVMILLSGFLDAVDGVLARASGRANPIGGFLDSVSDRYSDGVVLAAAVVAGLCEPIWGLAAVIGSLMVSYTRARAEASGVQMAGVGIAERAERLLILVASTLTAYFWVDALNWGIIIIAALSNLTVIQRAVHFRGKFKRI